MPRFRQIPRLSRLLVPGDDVASTPLRRTRFFPLIHKEVLERRKQKGPKLSTVRIGKTDRILLDQSGEELLRQVLGILRRAALAADKSVKRIPVESAKFFQRGARLRAQPLRRRRNHEPVRLRELLARLKRFTHWIIRRHTQGSLRLPTGVMAQRNTKSMAH
jgi:hypothetical protein